jgi:hypothetical protein
VIGRLKTSEASSHMRFTCEAWWIMQDAMMRDQGAGAEACEPWTDSLGFPHNTLKSNEERCISQQLVIDRST